MPCCFGFTQAPRIVEPGLICHHARGMQHSTNSRQLIRRVNRELRFGRPGRAVQACREWLESNDDDADVLRRLAELLALARIGQGFIQQTHGLPHRC